MTGTKLENESLSGTNLMEIQYGHAEEFTIRGCRTPYRPNSQEETFCSISIADGTLGIKVFCSDAKDIVLSCDVWEHTFYELESLAAALLHMSRSEGSALGVENVSSDGISNRVILRPSFDLEIGYSLSSPAAHRVRVFISCKKWLHTEAILVWFAIGLRNVFSEIVISAAHAEELSRWITFQVARVSGK